MIDIIKDYMYITFYSNIELKDAKSFEKKCIMV